MARQRAVDGLGLLDTPQEERFDRIVELAQLLFRVPIAYISLVDRDRQWLKSKAGLSMGESGRDVSFCGHAILEDRAMVVCDALQDYRFAGNPMVQGEPFIRFYAGQPLRGPSGHKVGTLCLADREPRELDDRDIELLGQLGRLVEREFTLLDQIQMQIENLRAKEEIERKTEELEKAVEALSAEKEHSDLLLRNIFPGDVADELKRQGRVKAVAHDIWGDTVNTAARLEQASERGRINLSGAFREMLGERILVEGRGILPIKHAGEIEMFFLDRIA